LSKNIKISTSEKASKSSHFKPDNQRQISLVLSYAFRYRMRLINLVSFAIFFEIMRLGCREYSKHCSCYLFWLRDVAVSGEGCWGNRRGVLRYSKRCSNILILNILQNQMINTSRMWLLTLFDIFIEIFEFDVIYLINIMINNNNDNFVT
jgi:hypothetical protein